MSNYKQAQAGIVSSLPGLEYPGMLGCGGPGAPCGPLGWGGAHVLLARAAGSCTVCTYCSPTPSRARRRFTLRATTMHTTATLPTALTTPSGIATGIPEAPFPTSSTVSNVNVTPRSVTEESEKKATVRLDPRRE